MIAIEQHFRICKNRKGRLKQNKNGSKTKLFDKQERGRDNPL